MSNYGYGCLVGRQVKGVSIDEIEDSKFLLQFYHEGDLNRVVDEGSWSFEQNLVVIKWLGHTDKHVEVTLDHADFWVQVHDLSLSYMMAKVAHGITNNIDHLCKWMRALLVESKGRLCA
ncbi:unnamed protein product [Cuscuta epithymum]|uniref:DUF4283 domain-containing protein n=1 Tax=Cuscuta epithymum TaxID=186058 RepID=A0AAV0ER38_9ASTE|nr:unnamed protein product [Cuscuta epithymum]